MMQPMKKIKEENITELFLAMYLDLFLCRDPIKENMSYF